MRGTKAKYLRRLAAQTIGSGEFVVVMGSKNPSTKRTSPTRYYYQLFKGRRGGALVRKAQVQGWRP